MSPSPSRLDGSSQDKRGSALTTHAFRARVAWEYSMKAVAAREGRVKISAFVRKHRLTATKSDLSHEFDTHRRKDYLRQN